MTNKHSLILGFLFLAIGIATGAFGAHALESRLTPDRLETWKTAVDYQMWNALGLILLALVGKQFNVTLKASQIMITIGIFIFSGSLYTLCLSDISIFGAITPFGGVSLIIGWLLACFNIAKNIK